MLDQLVGTQIDVDAVVSSFVGNGFKSGEGRGDGERKAKYWHGGTVHVRTTMNFKEGVETMVEQV